jgi:hypothetical protein
MTGRERYLAALHRQVPDHLPCQVHGWMWYWLQTYLGGKDQYQAYEHFDMDPVAYAGLNYEFAEADKANWDCRTTHLGKNADGYDCTVTEIKTPGGTLTSRNEGNQFTGWTTEFPIKDEADFEIWNKYVPLPIRCDWSDVLEAKRRVGERGIVRTWYHDWGQGSPWQSFCTMYNVEPAIMAAIDKPDWLHHVLESMLAKKLRAIEVTGQCHADIVETGGGAGSNTVISPGMHEEFCLPYDIQQHQALHAQGATVVYHLCGGLMKMLDLVMQNGADGLETMTPPAMGGDCDMAEAYRRASGKLFFIGGFDQNAGFEKGTPAQARRLVRELHDACPRGGYICCPSDHFFFGEPENVQAFADEAKVCRY